MYVPWLLNFIQKINFFPGVDGKFYLNYSLVVTKFSDTGAYMVGSLIGRHKMIPRVSPGKTWEGFAGAFSFRPPRAWPSPVLRRPDDGHELVHAIILGSAGRGRRRRRPHRIALQTRGRG